LGCAVLPRITQGGFATLGYVAESLWDSFARDREQAAHLQYEAEKAVEEPRETQGKIGTHPTETWLRADNSPLVLLILNAIKKSHETDP